MTKTITQEPRFKYTQFAWQGAKYDSRLGIKEISKLIRQDLKSKYPKCKFSVSKQGYAGGCSLTIRLIEASFPVFVTPTLEAAEMLYHVSYCQTSEEFLSAWIDSIENGSEQINNYYIKESFKLTAQAKEVMQYCKDLADSFNFDDSDSMVDYFHTNFYLHLEIGKWDKSVIITNQ